MSIIVTLLLSVAMPLCGQDSVDPGVVARLDWEAGAVGASTPRRIALSDELPDGVLPPVGTTAPLFGRVDFANGWFAVALEADPDSPRLWIDRDFDGDLAEERRVRLTAQGRGFTGSRTVLAPCEGETDPVTLELEWRCDVRATPPRLSVRLMNHRRGTVVLGGRLRQLALTDGNGDGRFDDPEADKIFLDRNGDGALQFGAAHGERLRAEQPFRLGDEGWRVRVLGASGHAAQFERSETVPPAELRGWPIASRRPAPGTKQTPPTESLSTLQERFALERESQSAQRFATLQQIGRVGTAAAFDALVKISDAAEDAATRTAALRALGNPAFLEERSDRLAALARKVDGRSAVAVTQALFHAGHPQRDVIYAEMLASGQPLQITAAARWLAYAGTEQAIRAIVDAVKEGANSGGRDAAYRQGARNLPGGPPIAMVLRAARDDYGPLRAEGLKDLGVLGHPEAVPLALELARERSIDLATAMSVCEVLGADGTPAAVAAILGLLENDRVHAKVRQEIVDQLRLIRADASVDVMVKALGSSEPAVRGATAEILTALVEPKVTEALLKRAKREKDEDVLPQLLEALGDHGDPGAVSTLLKRARSRNPAIRTAAVRALGRLGFHHDKVRKTFLSMLESRDWVDRVLALDAARAAGHADLVPKVLKSLDHDQWQVRIATVEALATLRSRDAVFPLIERLDVEEVQRLRDTIAQTLFELTGLNGGTGVTTWRRWWSDHGETFAVPDERPALPERAPNGTGAGFYGIPVVSERVVFLIDQSGSMNAIGQERGSYDGEVLNRLDVAVRETLGALERLDDRAKFNVILFHSTIHPWQDELKRLGPHRKKIQAALESKKPTGGTNIYDGLELALQMKDVDTIFLLSDGSPGQGKFVATPDILRGIRRENQTRRIAIHCIAIGMESALLRQLAEENGGRYVRR